MAAIDSENTEICQAFAEEPGMDGMDNETMPLHSVSFVFTLTLPTSRDFTLLLPWVATPHIRPPIV